MIAAEPLDEKSGFEEMRDFIEKSRLAGRTEKTTLRDVKFAFPEFHEEGPDSGGLLPPSGDPKK
jgi:hypothetical protein